MKYRIRNVVYKYRRRRAQKKICANAHSLEEVVSYAKTQYCAVEIPETQKKYRDQRRYLRESLILRYKPELLDERTDCEMPMDFHMFEIRKNGGRVEIVIDYIWNVLDISYSGSKREMKQLRKITQDIYLYYGVSEEDIRDRTERYQALVAALCG